MTKILVIEDEQPYRENILDLLEAEEFEAISANNGLLGVQLALSEIPDMILCDVMMPELDGYGVLKALRQNPVTAAIPFIFLTAKADKVDFRAGMALGADDYVTKPFTCEDLLSAIAARLERQKDITKPLTQALQKVTEKLDRLLHYDSVTNLPNRLLLQELFNGIIHQRRSQIKAESNSPRYVEPSLETQPIPLLIVEIDRFNRIDDRFTNAERDRLVKEMLERINSCLSTQDIIARLNLDQFAIILATLSQKKIIINVAQSILSALAQPFLINEQQLFLTASIGVIFYPQDGVELNHLVKKATVAMAHVKKLGGNHYQFYMSDLDSDAQTLAIEANLHQAIEREEFQVYYQPIVDLATGKISGAEALVRWFHPNRGMISPAEFIPVAEETGLIVPIGDWVLKSACAQAQQWISAGFPEFKISVNLSARQFSQEELHQRIVQIIHTTGLNPENLELELTESLLMENAKRAIATLHELKQLGIHIAIDDFGTGYATLSYLKQFAFDTLKIDQCFVREVNSDPQNRAILTAVIQLAHNLNLRVTAEGVETETERDFLSEQHCDAIQGYLFSRPLPAVEMETLLMQS